MGFSLLGVAAIIGGVALLTNQRILFEYRRGGSGG